MAEGLVKLDAAAINAFHATVQEAKNGIIRS